MSAGKKKHPLYVVWIGMMGRCNNPKRDNYKHYGGRGITVCERWHVFENFVADIGDRPAGATLERIDNDGNYEPGNCRWATRREQGRNTRRNRMLTVDGVTRCLKDWAEIQGIASMVILNRIKQGWSVRDAVLKPVAAYSALTEEDRPRVVAMLESGVSITEIAEEFGKNRGDVWRFIHRKTKQRVARQLPTISEAMAKQA